MKPTQRFLVLFPRGSQAEATADEDGPIPAGHIKFVHGLAVQLRLPADRLCGAPVGVRQLMIRLSAGSPSADGRAALHNGLVVIGAEHARGLEASRRPPRWSDGAP